MKRNNRIYLTGLLVVICLIMYADNTVWINFTDGSSRQIKSGILSFSRYDADGISHKNFVSQLLVEGNDTTIIPLNAIGSISQEPELVNVEYITGGEWVDPHDNMMLSFYPSVIRRRIYSDGTVQEDEFYDYGHFCVVYSTEKSVSGTVEWDGHTCTRNPYIQESIGDSIHYCTGSLDLFDKVERVETEIIQDWWYDMDVPFDLGSYTLSKKYDERLSVCNDTPCAKDYPKDARPTGWYYQEHMYKLMYSNYFFFDDGVLTYADEAIILGIYDQCLVIDGRRIDFLDKHNLKISHSFVKPTLDDNGGFRSVLKFDASYLGKNFHATVTDVVYPKQ